MGRQEKPLDPEAGPVQRLAHDLRVLREKAGKPTYREMAKRTGYSAAALSQAAAGAQVPSAAVVRAYAEALDADPGEWEERRHEADEAARESTVEDDAAAPPYRGLARFEPADSELFFGRKRLVGEVLTLVREHRFAAVFAPSGGGKSSLLRAGLVPALREETGAGRPAVIRVLTPGERPARTHEKALVPLAGDGDTWVVVDQFEEVFTLCRDRAERDRFLDLLLAARAPGGRLRVVVAVRGDFYGHCAAHEELAAAVSRAGLLVGPMSRDELREVVTGPAGAVGLNVERALTSRVVEEVAGRTGALPMLSHALLETWRRRRGRTLTLAAYEEAGGVSGAIAATAEREYAALSPAQARTARRVLLRLIAPGEGTADTRRPAERAELETGPDAGAVVERLAAARLITVDDGTVELVHEALITGWPRLGAWIDEDRERLHELRRLREAARVWEGLGRDAGAVFRGTQLARAEEFFAVPDHLDDAGASHPEDAEPDRSDDAEPSHSDDAVPGRPGIATPDHTEGPAPTRPDGAAANHSSRPAPGHSAPAAPARPGGAPTAPHSDNPAPGHPTPPPDDDLTPPERAFLTASLAVRAAERRAEARAVKRTRAFTTALCSLVVIALAAGLLAWQRDRSSQEEADKAAARRIASAAGTLRSTDPRTAALLGVAAWKLAPLTESRAALLSGLDQPEQDAFTDPQTGKDTRRYLVDQGRTLVSVAGQQATVWDVTGARQTGSYRLPADLEAGRLSPDGATFDLTGSDGDQLWRPKDDRTAADLRGSDVFTGFTDDGTGYLLSPLDGTGTAELHRLSDGKAVFRTPSGPLSAAAVAPGNRLIVLCPAGGTPQVWRDGTRLPGAWDDAKVCGTGTGADSGVPMIRLTPDGKRLAVPSGSGVTVWDVASGRAVTDMAATAHPGLTGAALSPDGTFLALTDASDLQVWRLDGDPVQVLARPLTGTGAADLTWSPGTSRTLRLLDDGTVRTYDLTTALSPGRQPATTDTAALGPDGTTLATATRTSTGYRLDLRSTHTGAVLLHTALNASPSSTDPAPVLSYSPDGTALMAADGGGSSHIRFSVWDVRTRKLRTSFEVPGETMDTADGIALGPGGRTLLVPRLKDGGSVVDVWDTSGSRARRTSTQAGPDGGVAAVRPDGRLVVGSYDEYARLPSASVTGRALADGRKVTALAFSPDGGRLAVGDDSGRVTLWDGDVEHRLGVLSGISSAGSHETVSALAFAADGRTLAVGGDSGSLQLWDTGSQQPLVTTLPVPGDAILAVSFAPDGGTLYASGPHAPLQSYDVDPGRAAKIICERNVGGLSEAQWRAYVPDAPYREICGG
ncbi:hypothetical protein ABZX85_28040 [Streptomyces sp. NPDC004539]|uniref:nSTAND1 domain-containing NTPase n=1 Tax=Streptomyces sp. NPDC004539 TaxID=3154280 RepID=UPI0033AA0457